MNGRHGGSFIRGNPGPQKIRNRNCRHDQNDRDNNQQLNERESILGFFGHGIVRDSILLFHIYGSMPMAILHFVGPFSAKLNATIYSIYGLKYARSAGRPEKGELKTSGVS
jgi:hypothetical protein